MLHANKENHAVALNFLEASQNFHQDLFEHNIRSQYTEALIHLGATYYHLEQHQKAEEQFSLIEYIFNTPDLSEKVIATDDTKDSILNEIQAYRQQYTFFMPNDWPKEMCLEVDSATRKEIQEAHREHNIPLTFVFCNQTSDENTRTSPRHSF